MNFSKRYPLVAACAVGVGALLAFAVPAGAAVSVQSQSPVGQALELGSTAKIDANGAVVFPSVAFICRPGMSAYLSITVTEAVDGAIASGNTYRAVSDLCTGAAHQIKVPVTPTQRPFQPGVAFAQASLELYGSGTSTVLRDEHNIQIS